MTIHCAECEQPCDTYAAEERVPSEAWGAYQVTVERYLMSCCCDADTYVETAHASLRTAE